MHKIMYQILVTALALSCFYGCEQEQNTPPKTVETETIQQAVVNAEASTSQAMPPVNGRSRHRPNLRLI